VQRRRRMPNAVVHKATKDTKNKSVSIFCEKNLCGPVSPCEIVFLFITETKVYVCPVTAKKLANHPGIW
jgi:hypothetical protein